MQDYPVVNVETSLGTVRFSITDGNHVHVDGENIVVNGVDIRASMHVNRYGEEWHPYREANGSDCYALTSRRVDNFLKDVSFAANKKIKEVFVNAVRDYAKANPSVFDDAEVADINNKIGRALAEVAELESKIKAQRELINDLTLQRQRVWERMVPNGIESR